MVPINFDFIDSKLKFIMHINASYILFSSGIKSFQFNPFVPIFIPNDNIISKPSVFISSFKHSRGRPGANWVLKGLRKRQILASSKSGPQTVVQLNSAELGVGNTPLSIVITPTCTMAGCHVKIIGQDKIYIWVGRGVGNMTLNAHSHANQYSNF